MEFNQVKIFTIATNNYNSFVKPFLESFQKYFLPSFKKEFIIFTDNNLNKDFEDYSVTPLYINHEQWPFITLKRYECIDSFRSSIKEDDLCIFADIDLEVINIISEFNVKHFFGVNHPGNYYVDNRQSLETNSLSKAYVDKSTIPYDYKYIQGCLWGGLGNEFIYMVNTLKYNTQEDLQNNIVAKWHDESHLNKFYIKHYENFDIKSSSYAYPENWNLMIPKFIIHKDKNVKDYPRFEGV
jgi:hypothetical protein